jgi:hypothetical protein
VRALLAARERDDVALAQLLLALVRAQRRLAAEDDRPFLVRVVGVKWPLLVTRLDLVHARADQLGVGVRADPGVLEAPALALFRAIPLVCVEIEDLHAENLVGPPDHANRGNRAQVLDQHLVHGELGQPHSRRAELPLLVARPLLSGDCSGSIRGDRRRLRAT